MREDLQRRHGTVRKWNKKKGYGFISNPDGIDVFVHYSVVPGEEGNRNLMKGDVVEYYEGQRDNGLYAVSILEVRRT